MLFQNRHKGFDEFRLENSKVSKNDTLMGCFLPKYLMFQLKKYRGAIFHDTRVWCKFWKKKPMLVWKITCRIDKFPPEDTKFSKLWLSLDPFIQRRKCMSLKLKEEFCVNEEWCKVWNRTDLRFQSWHEEFNKFWPKDSKISKICTLMGWFWPKL